MKPRKKSNSWIYISIIVFVTVLFLSIHISMAYGKSVTIDENGKSKLDFNTLMNELNYTTSEKPFDFYFNEYSKTIVGYSCLLCALVIIYIRSTKRKYIAGKEYGSADWGSIKQLEKLSWKNTKKTLIKMSKDNLKKNIKAINKKKIPKVKKVQLIEKKKLQCQKKIEKIVAQNHVYSEMILAQDVKFSIFNLVTNNNVVVFGGSGAGKTRYVIKPNILNLAGSCSFVITDPKGEIYECTRFFLQSMEYEVVSINLFEKTKSSKYNPFNYIHCDRENYDWQEDVLILIETMIVNLDGGQGKKSNDPFWDDSARHFIQSLFFFVIYQLEEKDRNMNSVMELLGMLEIEEDEDNYDSPLDIAFQMFAEKFGEDNIAYRTYKDFRTKASGKTAKSIAMTMVSKLQPYNIASMKALSEFDELQLDQLGNKKMALFVIVPPTSQVFNFVAGMIFTQIFQELNYCANALNKGKLPIPVQFMMDEFANTCVVPNFEKIIAYARSLGIGIMPILQSRSQLKGMYEKTWEVILDNCKSTIFLGNITSEETLKSFSERLGKGTFDEKDVSVSKGRSSSTSISHKKIGRELMTPAELAIMPETDCIIFINGKLPIYAKKYNYTSHKRYIYTTDYDSDLYDQFKERKKKSPHGEEIKLKKIVENILESADDIQVNKNPLAVANYINSKFIGAWNFSEENYILSEREVEEITWNDDINKELKQSKEEAINIIDVSDLYAEFEKNKITYEKEPMKVLETVERWNENQETLEFSFDYVANSEEEFFEDNEENIADSILSMQKNLVQEMQEVSNIQQRDFNYDVLPE